jgi:hypothetical protein
MEASKPRWHCCCERICLAHRAQEAQLPLAASRFGIGMTTSIMVATVTRAPGPWRATRDLQGLGEQQLRLGADPAGPIAQI